MRNLVIVVSSFFWILVLVLAIAIGHAQSPPQIPLAGSIGVQGNVAILGGTTVQMPSDANYTLTPAQWSNKTLVITSAFSLSATRNIVTPLNKGQEFNVENGTTGGQSIVVIGATGTGVTIANGASASVFCDGTNYIQGAGTGTGAGGVGMQYSTSGTSLSAANITGPVYANGSSAPTVQTSNQANAAIGKSNGLDIFGDSISQGTGTSSTGPGNVAFQQAYSYLWQQTVGGPFLLGGTSGDQEADGNYKWVYRVANPQGNGVDPVFAHELGTNDATVYQANANQQHIFNRLALGSLVWLGTPRVDKTFGQSCTLAGGMAASAAPLLAGLGVQASTNGATASCVTHAINANGPIYACYLIQDSNGGTFTLSLDGTPQTDPFNATTTWDAFGDGGAAIHTTNSTNDGVACARFTGTWAANSAHTVLFTVTSATSASNIVWPQWVGSAPASSTLNPYVIAIRPNQQNTSSAGAPYVATYQGFIQTIVTNLAADGENVSYSDTSDALLNNPSCGNGNATVMFANCYSDAVHPNNLGHSVMAATAVASTPASALLAVTHWNPQQPGQNYLPAAPLTPYQFFDVNPYNLQSATAWNPGIKFQGANGQVSGISYQGNTGLTFFSPAGTLGFSFCPWGGSGFLGSGPPTLASCFMDIVTNGQVNMFGGSSLSGGSTFQSSFFGTGTGVTAFLKGVWEFQGNGIGNSHHGVWSTTAPTSGANNSSPCWSFVAGVWNAFLGQPGFDGPCLQGVPISPTPGGSSGQVYLTLNNGNASGSGLDLRNTTLLNHLFNADVATIGGSGTVTLALGATAQVGAGATGPTCLSGYDCNGVAGNFTFTTGSGTLAAGTFVTAVGVARINNASCTINTDSATYIGANSTSATPVIAFNAAVALASSTAYNVSYVCWGN